MTHDEEHSMLSEKLDNITSRLILACRENDRARIKQCRMEAKRVLMDFERFIEDLDTH